MSWRSLLQSNNEHIVLPWLGGRVLRQGPRAWTIKGRLPAEIGWYSFKILNRTAEWNQNVEAETNAPLGALHSIVSGYLVGDRLVKDDVTVDPDPKKIVQFSEPVALIEPGLERFARVKAGRICEDGALIYQNMAFSLGPEDDVLKAFEDQLPSVNQIKGVVPALDAAFRMETWQRSETERRRLELERERAAAELKRAQEERRRQIVETLGDAVGRREMALVDFKEAATAALAIGGAQYLDHRVSRVRNEMVVKFRLDNRRFECVCDRQTLRITDAGICLNAHDDDDGFEAGTRGDTFFTLESLPSVIREAIREGKLVVFRHVE